MENFFKRDQARELDFVKKIKHKIPFYCPRTRASREQPKATLRFQVATTHRSELATKATVKCTQPYAEEKICQECPLNRGLAVTAQLHAN